MNRWNTLDGRPPRVIAHRGASGLLPEHTLEAYRLALQQGADVIEPDLVLSRDGIPVARHERALGRSTDVAQRPAFGTRAYGGEWHAEHFTLAELQRLRAIQPFPGRPVAHDRRYRIPSFAQVLNLAAQWSAGHGVEVIVYPELKDPDALAIAGLDSVASLAKVLQGRDGSGVTVWVQCFVEGTLARVVHELGLPVHLLFDLEHEPVPAALPRWLAGVGLHRGWLARAPGLVDALHARGLAVHAWTYRDDAPDPAFGDVRAELRHAYVLGVDAVFCDFPATGIDVRAAIARSHDLSPPIR